ncbi:MAG TPA: methyltransferase domain-containing protein [Acidobacteriota bacterium]
MKLHWFSPLPPAKTSIAEYSARLLEDLGDSFELVLWTEQRAWDREMRRFGEVRRCEPDAMPWRDLNRDGTCIYHIGNSHFFHSRIWETSRRHGGIVVLHDLRLQDLFYNYYLHVRRNSQEYVDVMARFYGREGKKAAEGLCNGLLGIDFVSERFPLTEWGLKGALAVLVHSREAYDAVGNMNLCPVAFAPLPYIFKTADRPARDRFEKSGTQRVFRLIIFGHLNRTRRLEVLLEALAAFRFKDRVRLDIYGQTPNAEDLRSRIRRRDLEGIVRNHGFVSEDALTKALDSADLAVNLRYPSMGEASQTQLRIWAHGLPSLVTRTGWYATLPEDTVAFVRPDHEVADIQAHLERLVQRPESFASMGERGARYLEARHEPQSCVSALIDLVSGVEDYRARGAAFRVADRAADEIGIWDDGLAAAGPALRVAQEISALWQLPERCGEVSRAAVSGSIRSEQRSERMDERLLEPMHDYRVKQLVEEVNRSGGAYHKIYFDGGLAIEGEYDMSKYLPHYAIPVDLDGRAVLDIGTATGFFAFECARRGAAVTAIDLWDGVLFNQVKDALGLSARYIRKSIEDLDEEFGKFDLVLCGSLLLHLRDIFGALERIYSVCAGKAILATSYLDLPGESHCDFVGEKVSCETGDYWVYWNPTPGALRKMLLAAGFRTVKEAGRFNLQSEAGRNNHFTPHIVFHAEI